MEQLDQLIHKLPTYSESATELLGRLPLWPNQTDLINLITDNLGSLSQQVLNVLVSSVNYVMSFIKGLFGILTILVFAFFLMTDTEYFEHLALKIVPESQRKTISLFLRKLAKQIGLYVRGQFLVMTAVGLLTGVGLALIGVHYALVLGLLSFLLDLIPIIGPLFATALGILVTLGENPNLVPWALLVYIVAQQIENYLLYPVILGRAVGLRPFWILLSLMCGGTLLGIVGVLLAIPAAITIHLIYMHLKSNRLPGEATA
jgi:predicted PurR-regulated permease PerM